MSVTAYKWMKTPFGNAGTLLAIPETVQGDGSVSYPEGFGPDYALDPATQPAALNIPRDKSNQLYNDITKGLKYYQEGKIPQWISTADNGGTPFAYDLYAYVLYTDGFIYQSMLAANTDTPGATANWVRARVRLGAATNFYVRTDGNDANTGLLNTAGGAFLTINGAIAALSKLWDLNGFIPTINIQAGTFAAFLVIGQMVGQSAGPIVFNGLGATTIISSAATAIAGSFGAVFRYQNMKVGSSASNAVNASNSARLFQGVGVELTGCGSGSNALLSANIGGSIQTEANYTISGAGGCHYSSDTAGLIYGTAITVTQTGTLAFNSAYAAASLAGQVNMTSITFSGGTITGTRYASSSNGVVYTNGGGANYFPGNAAGTTSTGGQYV